MGGGGSKSVEFVDDETSLGRRRKTVVEVEVLLGLLGADEDLRAFCRVCDHHATPRFSPDIALAVVTDGEMAAYLSSGGKGTSQDWYKVRTFGKGQAIPFFLGDEDSYKMSADDSSNLTFVFDNGLQLRFEAKTPATRCLTIGRRGVAEFISLHPQLTSASQLFKTRLTPLLQTSSEMPIIEPAWGQILSPLVELIPFLEGDLIESWSDAPSSTNDSDPRFSFKSSSCVGVVLLGKCRALHQSANIDDILDQLSVFRGSVGGGGAKGGGGVTRGPRKSSVIRVDWEVLPGADLGSGSVLGVQNSFLAPRKSLRSVFASSHGIIAYFTPQTMQALASIDPPLVKMWKDAFVVAYLTELKMLGHNIFQSISELNVQFLASKALVEIKPAGAVIIKQGLPPSEYILLIDGRMQEDVLKSPEKRELVSGDGYGSSSIVANKPYAGTVTTLTPSVIMTISQKTFKMVFSQDQRLVAEIKIRMGGGDVELASILRHEEGYRLFLAFASKEFATENVLFWKAVESFQEHARTAFASTFSFATSHLGKSAALGSSSSTILSDMNNSFSLSRRRQSQIPGIGKSSSVSLPPPRTTTSSSEAATTGESESVRSREVSTTSSSDPSALFIDDESSLKALRELYKEAESIVTNFVSINAETQINIPFTMRTKIEGMLADWAKVLDSANSVESVSLEVDTAVYTMFEAAQKEVYAFVSRDGFARWKNTPTFSDLMKRLKQGASIGKNLQHAQDETKLIKYREDLARFRSQVAGELISIVSIGGSPIIRS